VAAACAAFPNQLSAPRIRRRFHENEPSKRSRIGQTVVDSDNTVHTRARKSKHFFCARAYLHQPILSQKPADRIPKAIGSHPQNDLIESPKRSDHISRKPSDHIPGTNFVTRATILSGTASR
jgi:hypothetical protein